MSEVRPRLKQRQIDRIEEHALEDSEPLWVTLDRVLEKAEE